MRLFFAARFFSIILRCAGVIMIQTVSRSKIASILGLIGTLGAGASVVVEHGGNAITIATGVFGLLLSVFGRSPADSRASGEK